MDDPWYIVVCGSQHGWLGGQDQMFGGQDGVWLLVCGLFRLVVPLNGSVV
jgi:hypothetical protein